ncbi:MAG: archaea-specific SMC-related protein, partial [Halobacteriota archaeon]
VDLVADVERSVLADELDCWVCGSNAGIDDINSQVESLGETVRSLNREAATVGEEIDELAARQAEATAARRTKRTLEDEILALEETLADRRESLSDARQQRADVDRRIEALAAAVEETDDRRTDVTAEIKYTESKLADEREHVAALEREADRREHLESTVAGLRADIAALRDRKRTVKRHTRAAFDESIRELVSRFETSFESARLTSTYDIVVAREGREVSIDALSEGEVELLGIVAALAGYEAYDVSDITPVLVLDRIGGLADENLHTLVEYLRDEPDYLVFTAYPEHSPFEGHQIDPGEWHVVSDDYDRPVVS